MRHILGGAGFAAEVTLVPRPGRDDESRRRELQEVLDLAVCKVVYNRSKAGRTSAQ